MNSNIRIDKKEIIISIVLAILLSILSLASAKKYNESITVKEEKKYHNLDKSLLQIKPTVEYDMEEGKYKLNYINTTPANIIKANFKMYDLDKFIKPINFTEAVPEYSTSNNIFFDRDKLDPTKNFILLSDGIFSYKNKIYSFYVNKDEVKTEFIGQMPYLKEGNARYLVPKLNIVEKNCKKEIESYLYNVTKIDVINYEFTYEDIKTGESYSIKFDNVKHGEKSKKVLSKAPKSGMIKDVVPKESYMKIVNEKGKQFNVVYDFSTNLILDLDKYDKYINNQGSKNDETKN